MQGGPYSASPPGSVVVQVQPAPAPKVLTKCAHCGNVYDLTLGRCNRCGAPALSEQPPAPEPKKVRRIPEWVLPVTLLVIVAIVAGSVLWYEYAPGGPQNPYKVHVSQVEWLVDGAPYSNSSGFTLKAGSTAELSLGLWCAPYTGFFGGPQTCSSGSVTVETPGFTLSNSNAPFTWSSGESGAVGSVYVWVTLPNHSYSGLLVISDG
jgi:hypothetical protein